MQENHMARGKTMTLSTRTFSKLGDASEFFRTMLKKYTVGDRVTEEDAADLASLLDRHPNRDEKIGDGIDHFEVQAADYGTKCFRVVRSDGTWDRFSFKACVSPD
jgi:Protein of unknown function (DUF3223)